MIIHVIIRSFYISCYPYMLSFMKIKVFFNNIFHNPDKWRNDNVIITSTQCRFDLLMTLLLRYVSAGNMHCYHSNSQFHWGFSHKLVPWTARVFLWIQAASPIERNTNCWPQVRQWHAGEQFGSLVCWQLWCGHWVSRRRAWCSSKSKRIENSH